ncbi:MAG: DNA-protecting protein DprA [Lachnospiraceae bacterium]|nr:DNA-protecting protein DprA [Lachnospiraceae bacterium]
MKANDKVTPSELDPSVKAADADIERFSCFMLTCCSGMGPKSIEKVKRYAGGCYQALQMSPDALLKEGILSKRQADGFNDIKRRKKELYDDYRGFLSEGIRIVTIDDEDYPRRLKNIDAPPPVLYIKGRLPDEERPTASVIGARSCSDYGIAAAEYFAGELAACGVQIISGLAYGIDAAAASGALKKGRESYAVLGSGVNVCYPKENYSLYRKMAGDLRRCRDYCTAQGGTSVDAGDVLSQGGIISEFHPRAEALSKHFVMRNRIIAGLGDVLLVIEAREKSGTSITVNYALEQGKDVFALPGRITDPLGRGCNKLLKDGAIPLTEPEDVLFYLGIDKACNMTDCNNKEAAELYNKNVNTALYDNKGSANIYNNKGICGLSNMEKAILSLLSAEPEHIETVSEKCCLELSEAGFILSNLELKGLIEACGGAYWKRVNN